MKRRDFLAGAAAGAAAIAGLPRAGWAQRLTQQAKLDRIAIMTLNFQSLLKLPDLTVTPERTLEVMDIAQMIADTYGVRQIEFQHYHIPDLEPSYLRALRERYARTNSRITQINLEFGAALNISAPDNRSRLMAIDLTKQWVDHAVLLGAQRVMANQGALTEANSATAIEAYRKMVDYGKSKNIIVSLETRGNAEGTGARAMTYWNAVQAARSRGEPIPPAPKSDAMLLADVIEAAGGYSNVDVGGARAANQAELHAILRRMAPFTANSMHTRVNANWDLATAMRFLENDLGWRGLYTIEVGNGHVGTKQVFDVVMATL